MWRDRLLGQATPSTSPPARPRSQSPAARRAQYLGPLPVNHRPGLSPRSSSLNLSTDPSTSTSSSLQISGSLKQPPVNAPPAKVQDPLQVVECLLGSSRKTQRERVDDTSAAGGWTSRKPHIDQELVDNFDFAGSSLYDFVNPGTGKRQKAKGTRHYTEQFSKDFEQGRARFEELHRSILGCDEFLKVVEINLCNFQTDLGAVSAEIENLQARSARINKRLENREAVEKHLGPAVEELSISPAVVKKISEGPVDENWVHALAEVENRFKSMETASAQSSKIKAADDIRPLLTNLINKALQMIRDYLVSHIRSLRSPNVNAQIIQQKSFLPSKDMYGFMNRHHPQLAEGVSQAYINTMRWYYLNHFSRYTQSLEKLKLYVTDKHDLLSQYDVFRKSNNASPSKDTTAAHDILNIGNRRDLLRSTSQTAMTAYLAEDSTATHYLEVPFRNFNLALVDNASAEYAFLTEFFPYDSAHPVWRKFTEIFEPTFALGQKLTRTLIENTTDCLGVLMCVRINQHFAFELQRRRTPALDSYINATNMLLWPRLQIIMDMHGGSIRKATSMLPGRVTSSLSLTGGDSSKQSAAPHLMTQRFGQLLQGILALSDDASDDEPVSSSLGRLRSDFEAFLTKLSKGISDARKRERFLLNNYSLILTIISDTTGKLAEEQKTHFEKLCAAPQHER